MIITAIILAAGKGERMKSEENKVFLELKVPILVHTISAFEKNENIDNIIVVANEHETKQVEKIIQNQDFKKIKKIVTGGKTRQE